MPAVAPWSAGLAQEVISDELTKAQTFLGDEAMGATAMLPILHALQHTFGFVSPDAVPIIADRLNVSKAEVRGVLSFYHDFHHSPPGRHTFKVCRAEACQANGCEQIVEHLATAHALYPGRTTGNITMQNVYCLGNCALGPAVLIDDELVAGFDKNTADARVLQLQGQSA